MATVLLTGICLYARASAIAAAQFTPGLGIMTLPGLRGMAWPYEIGAFVCISPALIISSLAVLASAALIRLAGGEYSRLVRFTGSVFRDNGAADGAKLDGRKMLFVDEEETSGAEACSPLGGIAVAGPPCLSSAKRLAARALRRRTGA